MKKILFILMLIISIYFIYNRLVDSKIYYVNIGNDNQINENIKSSLDKSKKLEKYVNINASDYRITDLINDIESSKTIGDKTINNILIKADIITLSLGQNEIDYKINTYPELIYDYIDQMIYDIDTLFKMIRLYSKEKIYFIKIDIKNPNYKNEINYLNKRIKEKSKKYNIIFIDDIKNILSTI